MASYLRPRRGKKATAESQQIVLKRGEVFFECPDAGVGTGKGKIKVGDGATKYASLPYFMESFNINASDATIAFTDCSTATDYSNNATYLSNIKPANSIVTLFTNLKQLLFNYNSQLTQLNNDCFRKANVVNNLTTTASGKALDGRQGKVLNDKITNLNNDITPIRKVNCADNRYLQGNDNTMHSVLNELSKTSNSVSDYTHIHCDKITVNIGGKNYIIPDQLISVAGSIGQNFYVYANTDGTVSASTTKSADTGSMTLIGGFHYGRIRKSTSESDVTIGIVPNSVWTLYHRPVCDNPDAMVYLGNKLWGDIYLTRSMSSASSTTGGAVYDSSAYNSVPATGSEGYCQYTFVENLGKVGKRPAFYSEFVHAADGSPQGHDNDNTNAWTKTSNTRRNNTGLIERAVSLLNVCDLVGNVWKWCSDYLMADGSSYSWRSIGYDAKGKGYQGADNQLRALVAGGSWGSGANCGSRAVCLDDHAWYVTAGRGCWAVAASL